MTAQANVEKQRLEQKQRAARKAADRGEPIRPRWFRPVPGAVAGEQQTFVYSGGYWCARSAASRTLAVRANASHRIHGSERHALFVACASACVPLQ